MDITEIKPQNVFKYFSLLSSVPHGSGNTKAVSDICVSFAKEKGLEYYQDELNNVVIYKDGTGVYTDDDYVILQGHLDMVCVKTEECTKDLSVDPVDLKTDGEFVWADMTSLGADDIIAPAMILSILDDDDLNHPPICAVFTSDEETGLLGANGIDITHIKGKRMINIDSEIESVVTCGCAGAMRVESMFPLIRETVTSDDVFYSITVDGLLGGHSGIDITKHRGNAVRLLARIIYGTTLKWNIRLCSFSGGLFDNAIPSSAKAVVAVNKSDEEAFAKLAMKHEILFRHEFSESDPDVKVHVNKIEYDCDTCLVGRMTKSIMSSLSSVPDGCKKMNESFPELPSVSSNIGIAEMKNDKFNFVSLIRSNESEGKEEVFDQLKEMAEHDGAAVSVVSEYPEWEYNNDSYLKKLCIDTYREIFNKDMTVTVTHGGLETAVFSSKIHDLDVISIGPDIFDIHSVNEKLSVQSVGRIYSLICSMLSKM